MIDVFEFKNYRSYLKRRIESLPKRGYGQAKKLAEFIGVSTTLISHILSEQKHLTTEQAFLVCEYFGLSELETKYYLGLIQLERAGTQGLKKFLRKEIDEIKDKSQKISNRLEYQQVLTDEQRALFYSEWYYSAIRMLTSIPGYESVDKITEYLGLPRKIVNDAVQFLIHAELIVEEKGRLKIGPLSTHLDSDSPWVKLHHANWRQKALEYMKYPHQQKLHYSSPMTVSKKDVEVIRTKIIKLIEDVGNIVDPSPSEEFMCLNIDWFKVHPKT